MSVRAKFKCYSINRLLHWNGKEEIQSISLSPVLGDSKENKKFYAATPSGDIKLNTINIESAKYFELGKEYYVDFTKA